jgi:hypothetical protein
MGQFNVSRRHVVETAPARRPPELMKCFHPRLAWRPCSFDYGFLTRMSNENLISKKIHRIRLIQPDFDNSVDLPADWFVLQRNRLMMVPKNTTAAPSSFQNPDE